MKLQSLVLAFALFIIGSANLKAGTYIKSISCPPSFAFTGLAGGAPSGYPSGFSELSMSQNIVQGQSYNLPLPTGQGAYVGQSAKIYCRFQGPMSPTAPSMEVRTNSVGTGTLAGCSNPVNGGTNKINVTCTCTVCPRQAGAATTL